MGTATFTATETHDDYSLNEKVSVFGGEEDTWGANLTPGILNDPSFAIKFDANVGDGLLCVDDITVEVFFTLPAGQYDVDGLPPWATKGILSGTIGAAADGSRLFVVVGKNGTIKTSPDGLTWTNQVSGDINTLRGVAFNGKEFAAVGDAGTILTSQDGLTWTKETSHTTEALSTVMYDPEDAVFVAGGKNGLVRTKKAGQAWAASRR